MEPAPASLENDYSSRTPSSSFEWERFEGRSKMGKGERLKVASDPSSVSAPVLLKFRTPLTLQSGACSN